MGRSSQPSGTPSKLSDSVQHKLNMYALAASAAGVGMLASAQPANARIVYTPANIRINHNEPVELDLNRDGTTDFTVTSFYRQFTTFTYLGRLAVGSAHNPNNQVWGIRSQSNWWAAPLSKGVRIGSNGVFQQTSFLYMANVGRDYGRLYGGGAWVGKNEAYLKLKFQTSGQTHYGWARLNVRTRLAPPMPSTPQLIVATITGYAYETIPNKPIIAGKTKGPDVVAVRPASLGHLATGASAIPAWRAKQTAATTH